MKAVRIHEDGGPEVLRYEDVPDPEPGPWDVLIRLRAASLNHLDVWVRKGLPSVPKPRILGADGAGIVEAVGDGVTGFAPGLQDRFGHGVGVCVGLAAGLVMNVVELAYAGVACRKHLTIGSQCRLIQKIRV